MNNPKLNVQFEFTQDGYLEAIHLIAGNDKEQQTLEVCLDKLFKPCHANWLRRLFKRNS
jgi:hypothetical protein